jgi:2-(1,2-epoxy-1,2-dihydrophenyl)acetyl-CoA isomerase
LTVRDAVARLCLLRDDGRNAIDPEWVRAVGDAITACATDERVRALLIRAEGLSFSVGGDLHHFGGNFDRLADELGDMITPYHEALARLAELPVPVVPEFLPSPGRFRVPMRPA